MSATHAFRILIFALVFVLLSLVSLPDVQFALAQTTIAPEEPAAPFISIPVQLFIQYIILGILGWLLARALAALRLLILAGVGYVKSKLSAADYAKLERVITDLVHTAEQLGVTDELFQLGKHKKAYVLQRFQEEAARLGLTHVDLSLVDDLIEAKVNESFGHWPIAQVKLDEALYLPEDFPEEGKQRLFAILEEYATASDGLPPV